MRKLRHSWRLFGRLFYPGVAAECILGRLIHPDMHVAFTWIFLFSCVRLFMTPWTEACQASLSFTISQSLLTLMSIESVMPSNHLILCCPFSSCLQSFPASGFFPSWLSHFTRSGQDSGYILEKHPK